MWDCIIIIPRYFMLLPEQENHFPIQLLLSLAIQFSVVNEIEVEVAYVSLKLKC